MNNKLSNFHSIRKKCLNRDDFETIRKEFVKNLGGKSTHTSKFNNNFHFGQKIQFLEKLFLHVRKTTDSPFSHHASSCHNSQNKNITQNERALLEKGFVQT